MWLNIGLRWKITKIRIISFLVSYSQHRRSISQNGGLGFTVKLRRSIPLFVFKLKTGLQNSLKQVFLLHCWLALSFHVQSCHIDCASVTATLPTRPTRNIAPPCTLHSDHVVLLAAPVISDISAVSLSSSLWTSVRPPAGIVCGLLALCVVPCR